jgi:DNA-binding NtrC family response regulator
VKRTILVVDDDDSVRFMLSRLMRSRGFATLDASNAAIARVVAAEHPVALFIVDIVMPGESGLEFAGFVVETWPRTPIILISGYAHDEPLSFADDHDHVEFVTKPFGADEIIELVETMVELPR